MSHISYSELKEWTDCAWKHKLNYIDKIKQFKGNEHTSFGSALHTVCEELVQSKDEEQDFELLFEQEFVKNLQRVNNPHQILSFLTILLTQCELKVNTLFSLFFLLLKNTLVSLSYTL